VREAVSRDSLDSKSLAPFPGAGLRPERGVGRLSSTMPAIAGSPVWIEHGFGANAKLKKSPL